jgi:hypothetical protein
MLYEAGNDPRGQLAVGQVILNRVRHRAFPASVCGVVVQGSERPTGCQFTFTCDGSLARHYSAAATAGAASRADLMLSGLTFPGVGRATHYHTTDVYPWWSARLAKIAQVGTHLFFRWRGTWGTDAAMSGKRMSSEPAIAFMAPSQTNAQEAGAALEVPGSTSGMSPRIRADAGVFDELAQPSLRAPGNAISGAGDYEGARRAIDRSLAQAPGSSAATAPVLGSAVLAGSRLLRAFPDKGVFYIELATGASLSEWRRAATLLCGGRRECRVYGWPSAASTPATFPFDAGARRTLRFQFAPARAPVIGSGPVLTEPKTFGSAAIP